MKLARLSWLCVAIALPVADRHTCAGNAIKIEPVRLETRFVNEWSADWERAFMDRARDCVTHVASDGRYGNTFFENEKQSYGNAMMSLLGGYDEPALKFLQAPDNPGNWPTHTEGIDYYACFTLKHQMRKYFYFGDRLDPEYRARMKRGAKAWTEKDPLNRPHHAFENKTGWGPDAKDSWVDVRNTDNLKLMRDTSVYLMAEETGNEETRKLYQQKLTQFLVSLYYVGMGEWDSENYLGHSMAPLLNLYDFAKDPEVKLLAKAGLDFMAASLAVKYYRGAYNGPTRRDYNHPYPFGGSAAFVGWLWFGDSPAEPDHFESDTIHYITSAYRPPAAVVELARKNFDRPVELLAAKPAWEAWRNLDADRPAYHETQYIARHFQFGTLARGTQEPDVNGFKIVTESSVRGADTIMAAPCTDPTRIGSPMYDGTLLAPNSAVGHNGNMAIYLTQQSDHPYLWLIPVDAEVTNRNGVTFVRTEKTTLAIWPINTSDPKPDPELTEHVQVKKSKPDRKTGEGTTSPRWPNSRVLRADRIGDGVYGFTIEVDEGDPEAFMAAASTLAPEVKEVTIRGAASMTTVSGRRVRLQWAPTLQGIGVWRNGQKREWDSPHSNALFHTVDDELVDLPWQGDGKLRIEAGGQKFTVRVSREGEVEYPDE
jgi:hypothetical protein